MSIARFFELLTWRDAVDVLVVTVIIYNLLLLVRGTRAVQMLGGLAFVGVVYYIAQLAELPTVQKILENLLINIFTPDTPLHDGAVIVQDDRVAAAACFLPLTANPELSKEFGTRHRAALGVTEETDAVAVVVSEETGIISVCFDGEMMRDLDGKSLRNTLYKYLITDLYPQVGSA